jgi:HAT1-interacting factor 1
MATDTKASESASPDKLHELITSANLQYSLKNYDEAAEIYSQATEIQAEANGEMSPENAELLYLYGRCLFKVAVSKSDVLGGQVASEKKKAEPAKKAKKPVEEAIAEVAESKAVGSKEKTVANQPFFQITGDENWDTDSDDEDTAEAEAGPAEEDDDDFATAYEILDVARVLYVKQLEALEADPANSIEDKGKGKATGELATLSPETRHVKERLADTHDLQAEISLENERFHDAINDSRASLVLRQEIFPKESEMIAEAHYKLALALEFASVTSVREAEEADKPVAVQESDIDQKMRDEAAEHMEAAIESCRARVASEEKKLESLTGDEAKEKKRGIVDVNEIIQDMKQRVSFRQVHKSD